jgi:hypothetical protein
MPRPRAVLDWQGLRHRARGNARAAEVIEATLVAVEDRIRRAQPAPSTRLTFEGGTRRAANIVKKMREEEMPRADA